MAAAIPSARDTSTRRAGRDIFADVAAARAHPDSLPTPPNSISPGLQPQGLKAQLQKARLDAVDSDLELHQAAAAAAAAASSPSHSLSSDPDDAAGHITPALLARHHLPDILLQNGPLAIRHVLGFLTGCVPGFAAIPPAKARRLVVAALEGRGHAPSSADSSARDQQDVQFEKVGWGRWDARRRGQPPRHTLANASVAAAVAATSSPGLSTSHASGIPISKPGLSSAFWNSDHYRSAATAAAAAGSSPDDTRAFSHDGDDDDDDNDDAMMLEDQADKMSMDGSASASCSEAPDDDIAMNDDPEDATDDEDWATMGAAALRAASHPNSSFAASAGPGYLASPRGHNTGMARAPQFSPASLDFSKMAFGSATGAQEREAVEALLRLGSV